MTFQIFGSKLITYRLKAAKPPADCWQPVFSSPLSSSLPNGCWQPLSNAPSATINNTTASRAIRTKSDVECHQEPFSFPSGSSESTTPTSARSARVCLFSLISSIFDVFVLRNWIFGYRSLLKLRRRSGLALPSYFVTKIVLKSNYSHVHNLWKSISWGDILS